MPWLATAYVPGPAFSEDVIAYGPLPGDALWRLLSGLAHALDGGHRAGLVHRWPCRPESSEPWPPRSS